MRNALLISPEDVVIVQRSVKVEVPSTERVARNALPVPFMATAKPRWVPEGRGVIQGYLMVLLGKMKHKLLGGFERAGVQYVLLSRRLEYFLAAEVGF